MTEEQKKTTGRPIGHVSNFRTLGGGKHSEVQKSENSDTQIAKGPDSRKSKHPEWKQQTIYLPPALAKWLKVHSAQAELEISEIVALALKDYQERHP